VCERERVYLLACFFIVKRQPGERERERQRERERERERHSERDTEREREGERERERERKKERERPTAMMRAQSIASEATGYKCCR